MAGAAYGTPASASTAAAAAALARFADPAADAAGALAAMFDFVRPRNASDREGPALRYTAVIELLETDPARAAEVRRHVLHLLATRRLVGFFADSGILPSTGFFTELGRIVADRLLADVPDPDDLRGALRQVFHRRRDWVWFSALPTDLSRRFWHLIARETPGDDAMARAIVVQILEALLILSYRIGGTDVEGEFGRLGPEFKDLAACFRGLTGASQRYVDALRAHLSDPAMGALDSAEVQVLVGQCQAVIARARRLAVAQGTSVRLSYVLRRSEQTLQRISDLGYLLDAGVVNEDADLRRLEVVDRWSALVRSALAAESQRCSLRSHVGAGVSMLAMRVTENAAKTGEHYIAETRAAYHAMWRAAMGAGALIGAMALLKIFTGKLDLAPIGYALGYSLIYGLGFVVIYMLHLTVATKQPAMTAQTLAGFLGGLHADGARRAADLDRVVDLFAAVGRTQTAAILGNVAVAFPMALLLSLLFVMLSGAPPVDAEKAAHLLHDLDIAGWALPHAALAGVFLFLSGVLTGYFDNHASYARLACRVERLPWLARLAGPARAARIGAYLEANLGGLLGNFLFGCMLGTAGTIGMILGLPIDIRHIAFSSANLGFALAGSGFSLPWQVFAWGLLGVMLIGIVNLVVSFSLAMWMAMRARGIALADVRGLRQALGRRLLSTPATFFTARGLPRNARTDPPAYPGS
ncbi:MAG: site-specific recombinase [bacterium]|nr:site-specific recombinase [Betaproteobacteria bacterium]